jgi:hypothetical protein
MNDTFINQLNVDFLINKDVYKSKCIQNKSNIASKRDKKFYRKRILNLTKDMLLFKEDMPDLFPDVTMALEIYIKTCIDYFKIMDECDILQEDYSNEEEENKDIDNFNLNIVNNENNLCLENKNTNINSLLMRQVKINTLDKFVKKTIYNIEKEIIPIQKEINLKEPYLKNKGIRKKKNINNNYDQSYN